MATATRTMFQGDTSPALKGEAKDDTGVLDLSAADTLTVELVGALGNIIGTASALQPPQQDPDGAHYWNWQYQWAVGDTAVVDTYKVYLVVFWDAGHTQKTTFGPDIFTIVPKPV